MKSRFLLFSVLALCSATVGAGNYPSSLYVIGDATPAQWTIDNIIRMVTVEDGVYEYTADLTEGYVRFVTTYDYVPGYGPVETSTSETSLELTTGFHELEYRAVYADPDKSFKVTTAGRYKFRIDLTSETPMVEVSDASELPDQAASHFETVYAVGDATNGGWLIENAVALPETSFDSGIYHTIMHLKPIELFDGLKFMMRRGWNNRMYVSAQPNQTINGLGEYDLKYTTSGDEDWKFAVTLKDGLYEVTVDVNTMKLSIAEVSSYPRQLWVIGNALESEWTFKDENILTNTGEEGVYSWTGNLGEGEFKFYNGDSFGAVAYGAESNGTPLQEGALTMTILGNDDNKFVVEQAGNYTLTVDLKNMKLNIKKNNGSSTVVEEINLPAWVQNEYGIVCEEACTMALYDISGREVVSVNDSLLPFDGLNAGIYVLVIKAPQGNSTSKIVIR